VQTSQSLPQALIVRQATPGDASAISALLGTLQGYVLEDPSAAAPFIATITPLALRRTLADPAYRYHVALLAGRVVGVVGVRDRCHLHHLFVAPALHGRGLGRTLWAHAFGVARKAGHSGPFTVNSSRGAVAVYERFGFRVTGPEVSKHGIVFVPMELGGAQD
jgi:GNAT superfamily N-acetyltransferase